MNLLKFRNDSNTYE